MNSRSIARLTSVLPIHELLSLLLVAEPLAVVILAPREVVAEHLRVEVRFIASGGDGGRRRGGGLSGGAADEGEVFPAAEGVDSGVGFR